MSIVLIEPNMTSNNAPSPFVASRSSIWDSTQEAWRAFDNNRTGTWWAAVQNNNQWIQLDMGEQRLVAAYRITMRSEGHTLFPSSFQLRASNDGVNFTTIDTQTNVQPFANFETRMWHLNQPQVWRIFRWVQTATTNSPVSIAGLDFFEYQGGGWRLDEFKKD